jgi:selenocysteine-specific elongation factor
MQVIATAGHVDHGKSTLLRALTGMDPDRWEEEQRRGLTIDLGYAWLTLPSGEQLAFVDVPGHERFVPNMLAGVGPVPAVLFVVAADEGWMPQSAEHLAVVDALGISRGLLVVTRSDLADPGPAAAQAAARIAATSLGELVSVAVSAKTGAGLPALLAALGSLAASLPAPDPRAPVRLWVDRAFSISGSGTVVTGTLPAGRIHPGDELVVTPSMHTVRVRGLQSLGRDAPTVCGVARAALNLRGVSRDGVGRGMALVQARQWTMTDVIDVRILRQPDRPDQADRAGQPAKAAQAGQAGPTDQADQAGQPGQGDQPVQGDQAAAFPRAVTLHIGSARTIARVRPMAGNLVRLTLRTALPLHVGDRALLRDPGAARAKDKAPAGGQPSWPAVLGCVVLDVSPPKLTRRGAAAAAARELGTWPDRPAAADLLRRHGLLRASTLLAMGVTEHPEPVTGDWLADPGYLAALAVKLGEAVASHADRQPLARGLPLEAARAALGLPDRRLVEVLVAPPLQVRDGLIGVAATAGQDSSGLPGAVEAAVRLVRADLAGAPFAAPDSGRLAGLGLDRRALAAAARAGLLLRVSEQIVLAPGADVMAAGILAGLPQPFTAADARQALHTTRRTAIPLLEYLDRAGLTERLPDDRRISRHDTDPVSTDPVSGGPGQ